MYVERGIKPRRIDPITRIQLAFLSRFCSWRDALVVVRPETIIRWHRAGWRLFWRLKSRPGRPRIPRQVQDLIRRMGSENPTWGEERIANELLLKLGIQVSPRTVRKYLPPRPPGRPRGDLRWSTFLRLHARGIIACDFLVVVTATFRMLYVSSSSSTAVVAWFISMSPHIRRPHGHCSSCARPSGSMRDTNTCCMIAMASLPRTSTNQLAALASRCCGRRREARKRMRLASASSARSAGSASTG